MTNITMVFRWPIEIDGLPFLKMVVIFHGYVTNNQMVICIFDYDPDTKVKVT